MSKRPKHLPPKLDLRKFSRDPDIHRTTIEIQDPEDLRFWPWIKMGQLSRLDGPHSHTGEQVLRAFLPAGMVDMEGDSGFILSLHLIGVQFEGFYYGTAQLTAWISPNLSSFNDIHHIPTVDYDPTELGREEPLLDENGDEVEGKKQWIVPYLPKTDHKVLKKVLGRRIKIYTGPRIDD